MSTGSSGDGGGVVDLRSDTITRPTEAMREAMRRAEVGDDVYGEDPTVRRLEEVAAATLGKDAALFVPSGTMGNLLGVMSQAQRGDEAIVESQAHIFLNEAGGMAAVAGVMPRPVASSDGAPTPAQVETVLRPPNVHFAPTRLLCLENTHNFAGGTVLPPERMAPLADLAHGRGLRVHLDGARIFNAAVALGADVRTLVRDADSVMFCVSKALSAPVGSLLVSDRGTIDRARHCRKMVGGGMRQAGVLAAAGLVALETMVDRLAEDHRHARILAERLATLPGIHVDLSRVQTNMVMLEVDDAPGIVQALAARGVLCHALGGRRIRLVTHRHIAVSDLDAVIDAFAAVVSARAAFPAVSTMMPAGN